jgi:hypothetical protein
MNCRPGDLARIVGAPRELALNDRIVKLTTEPPHMLCGLAHWNLEEPLFTTMQGFGIAANTGRLWLPGERARISRIPDRNLRRIDAPGDDAIDEMVAKVGPAPMTLTEVLERDEVAHG